MDLPFRIVHRGLFRRRRIEYSCPVCKASLIAPMADAGKPDSCPDCGAGFTVPGDSVLKAEREAAEREAEKRKAAWKAERARIAARNAANVAAYRDVAQKDYERRVEKNRQLLELREAQHDGSWIGVVGQVILIIGFLDTIIAGVSLSRDPSILPFGAMISGIVFVFGGFLLIGVNYILFHLDQIRRRLDRLTPDAPNKPNSTSTGD